jgi:Arc/MetJ family transcription regulator
MVADDMAYCDMRTTLDLDDALMAALLSRHPDLSKTEAIEAAVRAYLEDSAVARLRGLAGKLEIEDVSAELRRIDRHT